MKVSGFSFIKNAITYDYPVIESIKSILPICDEFVIAVGKSDDDTLTLIQGIESPKIKILKTIWDDSLREGGKVLAAETDKAFNAIAADSDWAFYIQGDEVIHEQYLDDIKSAMVQYKTDFTVDGLLFDYTHFYGSYDFVGSYSRWYTNEVRIIRNVRNIYSYRDAQGFRKDNDQKLNVKKVDASVYHYGWVKHPEAMQRKQKSFQKLWHSDKNAAQRVGNSDKYDYLKNIDGLQRFSGTHPKVMKQRIEKKNWQFDYDVAFNKFKLKEKAKYWTRKLTGIDFNYKNYKLLK